MIGYILAAVFGYLIGSVPFGLLITRAAGLGDVRNIGSGNIGATNVLRTGRRELAALTLVLDAAKGFMAVMLARYLWPGDAAYVAAIAVFLGHCYPIWLGFKGGKGVATFIGVLLALAWPVGAVFCAVWLLIALTQKMSSLAALTAAVTAPIFAYAAWLMGWADGGITLAATVAFLAALLIYNHRANIGRLLNNTEPKINLGTKPQ
ncbi:MAG: glycerol-3-phosphate 1-O-acyltransferase PlsY [Devosia sp.]